MQSGYFAGMLAFFYRETRDGQRVVARRLAPLIPPVWMLVTPELRERFERRFKQAHVAMMLVLVLGVQFIGEETSLMRFLKIAGALALVVAPIGQWWASAGLPRFAGTAADLVPVRRFEMSERQARAMGPRMRVAFIVLGYVLAIPQLLVAILQDFPFGYFGFVLFAGMTAFSWHLHAKVSRESADSTDARVAS